MKFREFNKQNPRQFGEDFVNRLKHAYASLAVRGDHIVIRKTLGRPKGRVHIHGIEGF